jgi:hypothetical protein
LLLGDGNDFFLAAAVLGRTRDRLRGRALWLDQFPLLRQAHARPFGALVRRRHRQDGSAAGDALRVVRTLVAFTKEPLPPARGLALARLVGARRALGAPDIDLSSLEAVIHQPLGRIFRLSA